MSTRREHLLTALALAASAAGCASGRRMPSEAARRYRQTLVRETVRPGVTLQQQRQEWNDYAATLSLAVGTRIEPETIGGVACEWVRPSAACAESLILYAHGGGLVTGSAVTHRAFASHLAARTGRKVLLVDYRLLPENAFPAPLDDVLTVYRHLISSNAPSRIAFGGDSNGGGLMISALIALRDTAEPQPACAFSISGAFDASLSGESHVTRADLDPLLSAEVLHDWQKQLGGVNLRDPRFSPLFADLAGLAPILLEVGDHEVWLSDSLRMAEKIKASGGAADLHVWEEMWHVWPMQTDLPEADAALTEISEFLDRHLGRCA